MTAIGDLGVSCTDVRALAAQVIACHISEAPLDSRIVIRRLEAAGWHAVRTKGSHRHFKHPTLPGLVTVPHPVRDLPVGTLRSIERQSGVSLRRTSDEE